MIVPVVFVRREELREENRLYLLSTDSCFSDWVETLRTETELLSSLINNSSLIHGPSFMNCT